LGQTLWVNPLPIKYKLCSFNCLYCRLGASDKIAADVTPYLDDLPSVDDIIATLRLRLDEGIEFDTLALSGNGEPTLHPDFLKLSLKIHKLLKRYYPHKTLALLSNSSGLVRKQIRESVDLYDLPIFKLDVGRPSSFYRINRPDPNVIYEDILAELRMIGPKVHVQTVLVGGPRGNMNDVDVNMWIQAMQGVKPKAIEIYSINREIPETGAQIVPAAELERLAHRVEDELGIPVAAFGNWE
jgi:wyosine [tRNA(Phe)-imidazoG37] synthetase (radical SAM superfamily)